MFPIFNLGPLAIQTNGLIILIGVWIWFYTNEKISKKTSIDPDILSNHLFYSFITGIIGARLSLIIQNPQVFLDNPKSIISLNLNLFDFPSGMLVGFLVFLILTQRKNQPFLKTLDTLTPGILIFFAFIFLSFLANGKFYGLPSDLPWSIYLWGTLRHPLQLYYFVMFGLSATFVINQLKKPYQPGLIFWTSMSLSSLIVIFLEAFRGTTTFIFQEIRIPQIIALMVLIFSFNQLKIILSNKSKNINE